MEGKGSRVQVAVGIVYFIGTKVISCQKKVLWFPFP